MKRVTIVAGAMAVLVGIGIAGGQDNQTAGSAAAPAVKKQTVCPVMGGPVNTNVYADANGKRVYFCCGGCPAAFKKNPAKYIAKLEKDGVTLDKTPAADAATKPAGTEPAPAQGHDQAAVKEGGGCK